jgi:hypothetical protein
MTLRRRPSRQRIKTHRSHTVDEAARRLGVAKRTVRRWIKAGLPAITDQKPALILGEDLIQFLATRKMPSHRCSPFECYCVKCRAPRKPGGDMAEYLPLTPKTGNLRAICPVCVCLMHKRIRFDALEALRAVLTVTIAQPVPRLTE